MQAKRGMAGLMTLGLAGVTVTGCGSSGTKTVPKSQIIAKGDAICQRLNATIPQLPNVNPTKLTTAQLKSIAPALAKTGQVITSEVSQVRALGTPSTDAALFKQILNDGSAAASAFQAASQAAAAGNNAGFLAAFGRLQSIPSHGRQFGFHACDVQ